MSDYSQTLNEKNLEMILLIPERLRVGSMERKIENTLCRVVSEILGLDPITITSSSRIAEDLGADSLDIFQILMVIFMISICFGKFFAGSRDFYPNGLDRLPVIL